MGNIAISVRSESSDYGQILSAVKNEGFKDISGTSRALRLAAGRAAKAAKRDVPVLFLGDPGTGKELFAEAIHEASKRRDGPFLRVNCAAIPEQLLEAQLFGFVKNAFTGANKDQRGIFEQADGGFTTINDLLSRFVPA